MVKGSGGRLGDKSRQIKFNQENTEKCDLREKIENFKLNINSVIHTT